MSVAPSLIAPVPKQIGRYRIHYELGRGGMGVVYRAHAEDGPPVALKIAYAEMADHFGCMRREIHALSRLRHPGVVRIIEEGVDKGVPWYAMELLDSRSFDELLGLSEYRHELTDVVRPFMASTGPMMLPGNVKARGVIRQDLDRALTLMYRLARILAYVHAHGIVHRDLKPHNVLVRPGDRPVLVDFGLMGQFRTQSGREVLEVGGLMMGTAVYAAPEQASGELVDARADLYSFGAMLYEIVAGSPPFNGSSVQDVLMMHLLREPVRPSKLVQGVPPVLDDLIMRLLEKRRGDRFGYAEDVAAMLVEAGATPDPDFEIEAAAYLYRPEIFGRKETIEGLRTKLNGLRDGGGTFAVLGGESGIGKTSVAAAFAREATIAYLSVVTCECLAVTTTGDAVGGQALHPLRPLFRAIGDFCLSSNDVLVDRVVGPRIGVLRDQDPTLEALAEQLLEGVPRIPPEIASRRLFADLAETLAAFAREKPLVIVIDDLQWADEVTLRFLASLDEEYFANTPVMILGTYRADEVGPNLRDLLRHEHIVKIPLKRLDDDSVNDIVRSMLAAPNAPGDFLRFLSRQSEGNPFFVAEYLRAAVAERLLFREGGRWKVKGQELASYDTLGLPGTIRDLVARRLEGLSPVAQRVVEAAAVLGREIDELLLIAACGEREVEAMEAISELLELYVFDPVEDGVRFAHDKLREAAYARIPGDRRRTLHANAVAAIEAACTSEELLRAQAATLAHHCDVGGQDEKAIRYYSWAAEDAVRTGACREAIDLVNRAIAVDERSTQSEEPTTRGLRRARWHRLLCAAQFGLGDLIGSAEHARTGLGHIGVRLPQKKAGWSARLLLEVARQATHMALPRRVYRARETKVPILLEVALSAEKFSERSYFTADLTAMLASGLIAVNAAERLGETPGVVRAYSTLGLVASGSGLHRLANHYFDESRRLATAANDIEGLAHLGYASLAHYVTTCDWKRAEAIADEAVAVARLAGDHQVIEISETCRGHYEFYTGQVQKAAETYAAIRDAAHKRANFQHEAWGHFGRARSLIIMGRLEEAMEGIAIASKLLEGQNDHLSEVICHAHEAVALLHMGNLAAASEAADGTYALASRTTPSMWEMFRGFAGPAEVYLEVWSRSRGRDPLEVERMRRAVKELVSRLRKLAMRAPIVGPVTQRLAGVAECLDGNLRRGEKLLRKSAAAAARLGLPIDEGIAQYELVRHTVLDPRERNVCRERARTIFRTIGCDLYLQKMSDDPRRSDKSPAEGG